MIVLGSPPLAGTSFSPALPSAKTIRPGVPHDSPPPPPNSPIPLAIAAAWPPRIDIFQMLPSRTNPIHSESGAQKGRCAASVPGTGRGSTWSISRIHSSLSRTNTTRRPSGESAGATESSDCRPPETTSYFSTRASGGAGRAMSMTAAVTAAARPAATTVGSSHRPRGGAPVAVVSGVSFSPSPASISSIAMRASPMSRSRSRASLRRQRRRSRVRSEGAPAGRALQSGSLLRTEASVSVTVASENVPRPVIISSRTQPKAQMSLRLSTTAPRACSGLM